MTPWWKRATTRTERDEISAGLIKGAEINRLAAELQIVAGGRGLSTGDAMAAIATALANEVIASVQRNPNLTIDEMLDWACEAVREMARVAANPPPRAPKDKSDLTQHEFAQLAMRIVDTSTLTFDVTATEAMAPTAKALGMLIAMAARRPEYTGFDEILRWGQNAMVGFAREAQSKLTDAAAKGRLHEK